MRPFELNFRNWQHWSFTAGIAENDLAFAHIRTVFHRLPAAEPGQRSLDLVFECGAGRIIKVEQDKVARLLVLKTPSLGINVGLKSVVPVEMVRRDVQDRSNPRPELLDGFKLKAGNFQHQQMLGR